ncbi:MAG: KUP/HAK/KT family potassium transporter [Desulfovibrionaceae bacterium]|nr:KUP/HAK/KT family potassium transporter [Desulfovibrionaceae bacterium]MBF0512827.1 KUP/HAK/KT family potassium transporter [Desulfovibrionaceae bacterium]
MSHKIEGKTGVLVLSALGVVFGDLGTSPLYTLRVCFTGSLGVEPTPGNVLGLTSLIFWSLLLVVSLKYALFILRADDDGEGGIFAMLALLHKKHGAKLGRNLILSALFGSALLYGDGLITPVISVLSALEGLEVATSQAKPLVLPLTCAVLVGLFMVQSHGTAKIGKYFGPVILVWFAAIAALGVAAIVKTPEVLAAVNPLHAIYFFLENGLRGFVVLGAVVLCITGCEALYADMGHFGARSIRIAWYSLALPALLCNYFGQAALILSDPAAIDDPFYGLVPRILLYPMVALGTAATIIASQAIISGVFSLTRQAMQLGYMPRMRIVHTSEMAEGQVYIPEINYMMLAASLVLALMFKQSENLADAYGIAVTATMFITSVMFYFIATDIWGWKRLHALPLVSAFWVLDGSYFASCLTKLLSGGWFPVTTALGIMFLMATWRDGWKRVGRLIFRDRLRLDHFVERIFFKKPLRIPGAGVYLSTFRTEVPPMLAYQLSHTSALHEQLVILSILTGDAPYVDREKRLDIRKLGQGVYRVNAHAGFMETPDVPELMEQMKEAGIPLEDGKVKYYLGRISLVPAAKPGMNRLRRAVFTFMQRNAVSPVVYYNIPAKDVLELGVQLEF